MLQSPTFKMHSAGDQVFVGFITSSDGDTMAKIFGPVTICRAAACVTHYKGKEPSIDIKYKINSLSNNEYGPDSVFETIQEAIDHTNEELSAIKEKNQKE